jgi:serine protease AprX
MKRLLSIGLWMLLTAGPAFNQIADSKYLIRFTDKTNSTFSVSAPHLFLSQKAIERRSKQNISIVEEDIPVNPWYVDSIFSKGALVLNATKWFNGVVVFTTDTSVISSIKSLPFVLDAEPVGKRPVKKVMSDDKLLNQKFMVSADHVGYNKITNLSDYGPSFNQIAMMNGQYLHLNGFTGKGKTIAVIDAGFYRADSLPAFNQLHTRGQITATRDFVDGGSNVYEDHWHGMMVLSVMGGFLPSELVGVAPDADYMLLRSEEAATEYIIEEYNWIAAEEYADSAGADILTTSLGYTTFDDPLQNHTYSNMDGNSNPITVGADKAASKGMLVVNSAGNEGNSPWTYISAPADGDSVLAIGAVDADRQYVAFSGKGPTYDGRVKPNVAAQGLATVVSSTAGNIQNASGTSFSGPLVAGMAACLWQAHPDKKNMEIFRAIERSGDRSSSPDHLTGYGIPDFSKAHLLLLGLTLPGTDKDYLGAIYPNPFISQALFGYYSASEQKLLIEISDIAGRKVFAGSMDVKPRSYNQIRIDLGDVLSNGVFVLRVTSNQGVKTSRMVRL